MRRVTRPEAPRRPRTALLAGGGLTCLLAAGLAAVPARARCVCGFADGLFTTHTPMPMDGSLADWAPIHADTDNNVCDGPVGAVADRDAPVQSTGRDLTHFAYTWNDSDLFLLTQREGSSSNVQRLVYYANVDNDALMETGGRVIGVSWQGNSGLVELYLFEYVSAAPGGDRYTPAPDPEGYDANVTHLRVRPKGVLAAATSGDAPSFRASFRVRVD